MPPQAIASPNPTPTPTQASRPVTGAKASRTRNDSAPGAPDARASRTKSVKQERPSFERELDRARSADAPRPEDTNVPVAESAPREPVAESPEQGGAPQGADHDAIQPVPTVDAPEGETQPDVTAEAASDSPAAPLPIVKGPVVNPGDSAEQDPEDAAPDARRSESGARVNDRVPKPVAPAPNAPSSQPEVVKDAPTETIAKPVARERAIASDDASPPAPEPRAVPTKAPVAESDPEPKHAAPPARQQTPIAHTGEVKAQGNERDAAVRPDRPTNAPVAADPDATLDDAATGRLTPVATEQAAPRSGSTQAPKEPTPAQPEPTTHTDASSRAPAGAVQAAARSSDAESDTQGDALADERLAPPEPKRVERAESGAARAADPTQNTPNHSGAAAQDARPTGEARASSAPPAPSQHSGSPSGAQTTTTPQQDQAALAVANRGLEVALKQQGGSVQLRLTPESLGAMKIEMSIARGAVAATLQASTPEARELLSRNIETLRAALEAKGLSVERLSITLAPASQGGSSGHSFNANTGSPNTQHHAAQQNASNQSSDHDASGERSRGFFEHHERHRHDRHPARDHATDERLFQHRFGLHAIG
jgi:flagellar hook-length control protein FliK